MGEYDLRVIVVCGIGWFLPCHYHLFLLMTFELFVVMALSLSLSLLESRIAVILETWL